MPPTARASNPTARKAAGLSATQLAAQLGWSQSKVSKIENGRTKPGRRRQRLARRGRRSHWPASRAARHVRRRRGRPALPSRRSEHARRPVRQDPLDLHTPAIDLAILPIGTSSSTLYATRSSSTNSPTTRPPSRSRRTRAS
ncbi:helix-turn-helix domain-containing protein [Phytohabitans flavus]|uniref:helix-turn-helix domain-containing protein n=1 Tax=Phytohabitans flavus TaxID=1076124 RepID=UPI0022B29ABE|nr:helix-turn-helix transcriptional regulator [Phytohabitans flavus]